MPDLLERLGTMMKRVRQDSLVAATLRTSYAKQSSVCALYEHARRLSVARGLWFCMKTHVDRRFTGWVIPPFSLEKVFEIRANGIPCEVETIEILSPHQQYLYDRFGISELSRRYTFDFTIPASVHTDEIALTCHFGDEPCSIYSTYFWSNAPQVETPAFNMYRVARNTDLAYFNLMGYTQYRHIIFMIEQHLRDASVILDWGCGAARVLRHFYNNSRFRIVGADVDSYNIEWCRKSLGERAEFLVIDPMARCPFEDRSFDVVYGISVFTHLNPTSERFWLKELRRLLRPGGLAVMTVHGELTFFKAINDCKTYVGFINEGYLDAGSCPDLDVDGNKTISSDLYRNVFHTRPYIERVWGEYFRIVDYIPGGSTAHQDYVVMIRL
jgi:SAM-dependent methyltransferase